MRLKSYFAGTVEGAIALASQELGEEAMLVYSREASPEARYLGRYEVVFAAPGHQDTPVAQSVGQPAPAVAKHGVAEAAPSTGTAGWDLTPVMGQITSLRGELERIASRLRHPSARLSLRLPAGIDGSWRGAAERLVESGIPTPLVEDLIEEAVCSDTSLASLMESRFPADSRLGGDVKPVVAIIGPPGAGKTTATVNLAVHYQRTTGRLPLLASFDSLRIGGAEQLRTYAAILGAPFEAATELAALTRLADSRRPQDLVLIDTPGFTPASIEESRALASWLATRDDVAVHLVLVASMRGADLARTAGLFSRLHPSHLIFSRLDETEAWGGIWAQAASLNLPSSFFNVGPQIPEDFRPASASWLVTTILGMRQALQAAV